MSGELHYIVQPGGCLKGTIRVPGDKSISHRSVMLAALAEGETHVSGLLEGEDVMATIAAFRAMGVQIDGPDQGRLSIKGVGMQGLQAPRLDLDMGNSGTAMRLMAGLMAAQGFDSRLVGDASLQKRPMARVTDPLAQMGAVIATEEGGQPPLSITGGQSLRGIHYAMPVASAQVKSCLLLAGLYAHGTTSVTESAPTRDHTERMLRGFGYDVAQAGATVSVVGGGRLHANDIEIPADISSATFFLVGAAISSGSDVLLEHVGMNPTRKGVVNILTMMGADLSLHHEHTVGGEPVADIHIHGGALKGITIPREQVPLAIDELPALMIAAACAQGETVLTGAEELRVKESDRIAAMAKGLSSIGVAVEETEDGMVVQGGDIHGGEVHSFGDHRIAMAFAMAGLRARQTVTVHDCKNVATSFPGFMTLAAAAGLAISAR